MIPSTDLLITWIQTIRTLSGEELGRDVWEAPSPTEEDPAAALMLGFCLSEQMPDGSTTSAETLRAWLHASEEAAAHRASPPHPDLPPAPSRAQVCGIRTHFQGLTYHTREFGSFPCFGLELLQEDDFEDALLLHLAAGDTHVTMNLTGAYREAAAIYPARLKNGHDWTHDLPGLKAKIRVAVTLGLCVDLALGGDGRSAPPGPDGAYPYNDPVGDTYGFEWLMANLERILRAIQGAPGSDAPDGEDLTPYVIVRPGYDGVFYGWGDPPGQPDLQPARVVEFGAHFRRILPQGYLAIEHGIGTIPVGQGGAEYAAGMQAYDAILSEFPNWPDRGDPVWQIAGRLLGPAYHRPPDQPAGDDPHPPFYLAPGTPRGPYCACAFEYAKFPESRGQLTPAQVDDARAYYRGLGYTYTG